MNDNTFSTPDGGSRDYSLFLYNSFAGNRIPGSKENQRFRESVFLISKIEYSAIMQRFDVIICLQYFDLSSISCISTVTDFA